jgi:hypothetical protein
MNSLDRIRNRKCASRETSDSKCGSLVDSCWIDLVLADSGFFRFFFNLSGVFVMRNEVEKGEVLKLGLGFGEEDEIWGRDFRVLEKKRSQAI